MTVEAIPYVLPPKKVREGVGDSVKKAWVEQVATDINELLNLGTYVGHIVLKESYKDYDAGVIFLLDLPETQAKAVL